MMSMTATEKIFARASNQKEVKAGDIVNAKVDKILLIDAMAPAVYRKFESMGVGDKLYDPSMIVTNVDHYVPGHNTVEANEIKYTRDYAKKYGVLFYDIGHHGICHQMMVENGHVRPGSVVVGTDSHSTTYGALGAFSCGVSVTEAAVILATGECWFSVPKTIRFELKGSLPFGVCGKDVGLKIMSILGFDKEAAYKSVEIGGEGVASLQMSDRITISNIMAESGAKNGFIEADEKTVEFYKEVGGMGTPELVRSDPDAEFEKVYEINLDEMVPVVAIPHLTSNVAPAADQKGVRIHHCFIGSCTNGRLDDIAVAAKILKGKKIADDVRMIVIPASQKIYMQALKLGYIETLVEAGALFEHSCCGPCAGYNSGLLPDDEVAISTTNRNFKGRMGSTKASIYLASPATAAASALTGYITDPREYL